MRKAHLAVAAVVAATAFATAACGSSKASGATSAGCPSGGLKFGAVPFESQALLQSAYKPITAALGKSINCPVKLQMFSDYTAGIEAMHAGKLDVSDFGPLSYVLAAKIAHAQAVVSFGTKDGKLDTYYASIVTPSSTDLKTLKDVRGQTFAYSDPASTSGYLYPAYGLMQAGINYKSGVKATFAGSHTSSYEALRNKKVDAGELNSTQIVAAKAQGIYKDSDFRTLWKSGPIPQDPIAIRENLPAAFKKKIVSGLLSIDFTKFGKKAKLGLDDAAAAKLVPVDDKTYDGIRALVKTLRLTDSQLAQ
jgi:phosphonate transport system substrate-binding protein